MMQDPPTSERYGVHIIICTYLISEALEHAWQKLPSKWIWWKLRPNRSKWTPGCSNSSDYFIGVRYSLDIVLGPALLSRIRGCSATVTSSTLCWASHSCPSLQPTLVKENPDPLENMDFNGTWQVYSQENYEEFLRAMGEKKQTWGI